MTHTPQDNNINTTIKQRQQKTQTLTDKANIRTTTKPNKQHIHQQIHKQSKRNTQTHRQNNDNKNTSYTNK